MSTMSRTMLLAAAIVALLVIVVAQPAEAAKAPKVNVAFYVMSQCPDATACEAAFTQPINDLHSIVDLDVEYIARGPLALRNVTCLHGPTECRGNMQQLCAAKVDASVSGGVGLRAWNYAVCQSANRSAIPNNSHQCAISAGLDGDAIERCVTSSGDSLMYASALASRRSSVTVSCTVVINHQQWCQRDSVWKGCEDGNDAAALYRAICSRYQGSDKPAACAQYDPLQSSLF